MTRNTAREIAMHLAFELSFTDLPIGEFLDQYLSEEKFAELAPECDVYAQRPNARQETYIMYEIMYMPDIPHSVAINEAVELTRKYDEPETAKFVNGILGSFLRQEIKE